MRALNVRYLCTCLLHYFGQNAGRIANKCVFDKQNWIYKYIPFTSLFPSLSLPLLPLFALPALLPLFALLPLPVLPALPALPLLNC